MPMLSFTSPLGDLTLFEEDGAIVALDWGRGEEVSDSSQTLETAKTELVEYLTGKRKNFSIKVDAFGTYFQKSVWAEMCKIPYGETRTYGDIAKTLNSSPRAVGNACGQNPIPVIVPCHRVIKTDGGLGGYSGANGVETKKHLLKLEEKFK